MKQRLSNPSTFLALGLILFAGLASIPAVYGQRTLGTISGTVTDETQAVLPGVSITANNIGTGATRESVSDDEGRFRLPNLTLGTYQVQASLAGFQTSVRTGIELTVGREAVLNFDLRVGELTEEVMVTGDAPLVETTRAALTDLVDQSQIRDLPLNGRSFTDLTFLQPGVVSTSRNRSTYSSTGGGGSQLSIAGARVMLTSFLLDGTNIKDQMGVTPASAAGNMLGVEAIREFSVMATNYSAEYGGAGGVVSAVTKSGTNEFHGSVFAFHRNDNLDANEYFALKLIDENTGAFLGKQKPEFKRNQFGFVIGGPIISDKTFFISNYEAVRDRLGGTSTRNVPSLDARQGILSSGTVTVDPAVVPYLAIYPDPTPSLFVPGEDIQDFVENTSTTTDEDYFMVKVDHTFSESDSLFVRYTYSDAQRTNQRFPEIFEEAAITRVQYTTIEQNHIFSPEFFNTFRFAYNRSKGDTPNFDSGLPRSLNFFQPEAIYPDRFFGTLSVGGGISSMGADQTDDRFQVMNLFQFTNTMRYTRGAHSLSFGVDIQRTQLNARIGSRLHGRWHFSSLEDFLTNQPNRFEGLFPGTGTMRGFRQTQHGYFIQDDWQVSPKLTANIGLRWEFVTVPTETAGRVANIRDPADSEATIGPQFELSKLNLAPRIGFAYDPFGDGTTAIRTGFGIFHQQQDYTNNFTLYFQGPPFFNRFTMRPSDGATFPFAFDDLSDIPSSAAGAVSTKFLDMVTPYVMQYNFSIQRQLWRDTQMTVSYVGTMGRKISRIQPGNPNQSIVCPCPDDPFSDWFDESTLPDGTRYFTTPTARMNPNFTNIDQKQSDTNTTYNALQIRLNKRFSQGLAYQLSYTWGKTIDAAGGLQGGSSGDGNAGSMDPFDWKRDMGLSGWHIAHNFSANFSYDLPGANLSGVAGKVLGDWGISSIISLGTGNPTTITAARGSERSRSNSIMIGDTPIFRPNLVAGGNNNPTFDEGVVCANDRCNYVDSSQFEIQPAGTFGDLGKGTLIGPGLATVDLVLVKRIRTSESTTLEFRSEFFNIFNRINFGTPRREVFSGSNCGGSRSGDACQPRSDFGRITGTNARQRQIQFALKFIF